ncbi:hypothetical protein IWW50_001193, partial [Coemansia erecta]
MRLFYYSLLVGTYQVALLFGVCSAGLPNDVIRSVLSGVKGGILVKDGKRTSCELGVATSKGAYVAKDCLDYTSKGDIYNSTNYEVYLDGGLDGKPIKYTVTDYYRVTNNSKTLSNNYVYLRYNQKNKRTWENLMAPVLSYNWDAIVYVRRSLRDMDKMEWDNPKFVAMGSSYDGSCVSMSGLFQAYPSYFLCKNATVPTPSDDLSSCPLPYGTVYGITERKAHLMGIYSHATVNSNATMCNATSMRAYYTALYRHVNTVNVNLKWELDYDSDVFRANMSTYPRDYKMNEQNYTSRDSNVQVLRGDIFKAQNSSITFPPADSGDGTGTSGGDKNKKRNAIIIGVCVGVGGFFILVGAGLYIWWWRERHMGSVDPMSRNEYQNMLESDLGTLTVSRDPQSPPVQLGAADRDIIVEYDLPPVYDDPVQESVVSESTKEPAQQSAPESTANTTD